MADRCIARPDRDVTRLHIQDNEFVDEFVDTFVDLSVTPYRFVFLQYAARRNLSCSPA